jgi:hypothetical protein
MSNRSRSRLPIILVGAVLIIALAGAVGYVLLSMRDSLPQSGSKKYLDMVSAFYAGVTALDVDAQERAAEKLSLATSLVPQEPAAWANRGLLDIRMGNDKAASENLLKAQSLAPKSGAIEELLGLWESRRGRFAEAIAHYRRTIELDPNNAKARFALAQEIERQGGAENDAEAQRIIEEMLKTHRQNLALSLERLRIAAKRGDLAAVRETLAALESAKADWPPVAARLFDLIKEASASSNTRLLAARATPLKNSLRPNPKFRRDLAGLELPPGQVGEPLAHFLRMQNPSPTPSPPDPTLQFATETIPVEGSLPWSLVLAASLTGEGNPALFVANTGEVRQVGGPGKPLAFPGGSEEITPSPNALLPLDWNFDFRTDLVLAGAGGVRILKQGDDGTFEDVTKSTKLSDTIISANVAGAWAADVEMDGDLDVILGLKEGSPIVLRNNGDGTFRETKPFADIAKLRAFAWADLDNDGDPDAAMLDAKGILHIFMNERAGRFQARPAPENVDQLQSITIADLNGDGTLDVVALRRDGSLLQISDQDEGSGWVVRELIRGTASAGQDAQLSVADFDINGSLDVLASGPKSAKIYLSDAAGRLQAIDASIGFRVTTVADLNGDGRLDLAGIAADGSGRALKALGRGSKPYHWQVIRPRARRSFGDGRINSFGIGGEIEVRSGMLVQKQPITSPAAHFGLGSHPNSDVARVVWPNGTSQAEFDARADQAVLAEQRLKGSCPFVFAYDGTAMRFVTDFIWRSPLGLRINAQDTAGSSQTEDWVKIRGDQLTSRDGKYDIRITADLWETHFFDQVMLMAVDHPEGTEIFVDERFARTPPVLAVHALGPLRPLIRATDEAGKDVSEHIRYRDGRYFDTFALGPYQGLARDHWVEIELDDDVPRDRSLRLVAQGWIHPTDSSINVAIGQGGREPPRGLSLEVVTAQGGWKVAQPDLGFPAGKNKTILINLDGVFQPGAPRRLRLRTNLEIFWDAIAVAEAKPDTTLRISRIAPEVAKLRYRGFSQMSRANESSPELPTYEPLSGTAQRWRDLIGFHTRFGDVRELLTRVDDRYVIMNAGDELALQFPASTSPAPGWVRDFVLIGDGWEKDGDYNTAFSKTVLPLPSHDRPSYDTPPGVLEDDPVFQRYPRDWEDFHTRFVTPQRFQSGLRPQPATRQGN